MATRQERISRAFCFIRNDGVELYPVRMERRGTGAVSFRVSKHGNKLDDCEELADEQAMVDKVLRQGYAVRCTSLDGTVFGLYKKDGRSIREVRIPEHCQ